MSIKEYLINNIDFYQELKNKDNSNISLSLTYKAETYAYIKDLYNKVGCYPLEDTITITSFLIAKNSFDIIDVDLYGRSIKIGYNEDNYIKFHLHNWVDDDTIINGYKVNKITATFDNIYQYDIIKLYNYVLDNYNIAYELIKLNKSFTSVSDLVQSNYYYIIDFIYQMYVKQYGEILKSAIDERNLKLFCLNFNNEYPVEIQEKLDSFDILLKKLLALNIDYDI